MGAIGAFELSQHHLDLAAQQHVQLSSGERTVINAGNGLGLFAQQGDMRHIAHQGELLMQAQPFPALILHSLSARQPQ
ncbi:DUF2345 domain-containing protein [Pseudomonas aeruginosa]|nr:DUF2345 domain-containing protein [Pseudomonas aeruginosa]